MARDDSPRTPGPVAWAVFLFSIAVVLASFVSVFFPSLVQVSVAVDIPGVEQVTPDPFEAGPWAGWVAASWAAVFGTWALHRMRALPAPVSRGLRALFSFEVSRRVALASVAALLAAYAAAAAGELGEEEAYEDYAGVRERLEGWSIGQAAGSFEPHVRYLLLSASMAVFGSYKAAPFLASIALLLVTYLLTERITGKRFAGIASMAVLMQSSVFLTYDTTVSYTNFWILFYMVSLYMAYRFWPLSPVAYLASLPAKALTAAFLPMSIAFILQCRIPRGRRVAAASVTAAAVAAVGAAAALAGAASGGEAGGEGYSEREFLAGFASFAYQLRFDWAVMLFCAPLVAGLFAASRSGAGHAESVMLMIAGMLLIAPILTGFTNQTNQPYRFVPLAVFFAMGVGVILSRMPAGETSR